MDPDDYFGDDDLILDENVLAVLDAEEKKFKQAQSLTQAQQQQHPVGERRPADAPPPVEPPPPKKQKTSHEWSEEPQVLLNPEDDEGLPDISVMGGGAYRVPAAQWAAANELAAQLRGPQPGADDENNGRTVRSAAHASTSRTSGAPATSTSASTTSSVRIPPQPPPRPLAPALVPASAATAVPPPAPGPAPTPAPAPGESTTAGTSVKPPGTNRLRRTSTLSSVQAALAGFVPPPSTAATKPARPTPPALPRRASRPSAPPRPSGSPSVAPSQSRPSRYVSPQGPHAFGHPALSQHQPQPIAGSATRRQSVPSATRPAVQAPSVQPRPSQPPPPPQGQSERSSRLEMDALRAQLEDSLRAQEEMAKVLREERNVRYAKEGEASILRKNMEKTAKEYAAELARIKAAKEQAEAHQAQMQKEIAEERERLRTQFIFKQHELETSLRKSPWASRISRTNNQNPPSPALSPSQRRLAAAAGQSSTVTNPLQTPSRRRHNIFLPESPERDDRRKLVENQTAESAPPLRAARLPGFHNAFEPSPLKSSLQFSQLSQSTQLKDKGKGKARAEPFYDFQKPTPEDVFFNPEAAIDNAPARAEPPSSPPEPVREALVPDEPLQKQLPPGPRDGAERVGSPGPDDVEMKVDEHSPQEPGEPLQVPDWTKELHRIVLTHRHRDHKLPTLQMLMNHMIPSSSPPERAQEYSLLSANLLENLGTATLKVANTDDVIHSVQQTLSAMGRILCSVGSIVPLAALLDLTKIIALFIPAFVTLALAPVDEPGGEGAPPDILLLLCEAVRDHLMPNNGTLDEERNALAKEVLSLLETICWYTPPDLATRLSVFVLKARVLSTLVNTSQPTWLLQRTMRALTLLASYHSLWKHFLSFPLPETPDEEAAAKDFTRIPHIEQLASLLIDPARDGPECRPLREAVLNFVGTLAVAHSDALAILLRSHTLLPSLVAFLNDVTAPLWEEDEDFVRDTDLINWTVEVTTRTLMLLHHLRMNADSSRISFRQKLMSPPRRFSNALWHMFTVTLGRLSYACPPTWVGAENGVRLDQICDVAREVLDVDTGGPELEWIWNAFHIAEEGDHQPTQFGAHESEEDEDEELHANLPSVIVID